ncbi:succinylglutamate desuccinylase [Duganella sp. P38]|uniref:succinylglutamate desuccinylase n=1 Tax=Duganella sp. P38 TaxID=3423949 RepID=UPI003D796B18
MTAAAGFQFHARHYGGQPAAIRLIITGAVHGNETCGARALQRLMAQLDSGELVIRRGSLTLVPVANPLAYAKGEREGDRNLNRNLFPTADPQDFEDYAANWLCPLLAQHDVLLDVHSFSGAGEPFVMVGPRNNDGPLEPFRHEQQERALARRLGVRRFVDGWLRTYDAGVRRRIGNSSQLQTVLRYGMGTTEYMRSVGGYALTLECGQHTDPQAPEVAYRAILNTLAFLGMIDAPAPAPVAPGQMEALSMVAVYDKQHAGDRFSRAWASFDEVRQGEQIGRRADGTAVLAEFDGRILFPDAAAGANSEWYYLTRPNPAF